jgi:dTDP-4-dehydrorhamnose 3,5-epimerase-like enzyme
VAGSAARGSRTADGAAAPGTNQGVSVHPQDFAGVRIEALATFRDGRGNLFEPLDDRGLAAQKNVHVVLTEPGHVRGNHAHQRSTETTTVVGPCLVRLKGPAGLRDISVPAEAVWRFTIPPGIAHAYRNTGSRLMTMVSFNTQLHDPGDGDTRREVIL